MRRRPASAGHDHRCGLRVTWDDPGPLALRAGVPDGLGDAGRLRCGDGLTSIHCQEFRLPEQASAESTLP